MQSQQVGVIVARFQIASLHAGHRYLIDYVTERHNHVLVVLGESEARLTTHNPMDYATRAVMVSAAYPGVRVAKLQDRRSDAEWSLNLDALIRNEFPGSSAVLYGSRQSCLSTYSGIHKCQEIPAILAQSATTSRKHVSKPLRSSAFRQGVIYATKHRYPTSFQVVDVAVLSHDRKTVLLGKKKGDGALWRFLGGFVDPEDNSLEHAAKREVMEEASMIEVDDFRYLGSTRINDWRYPLDGEDRMLSAFFVALYIFGAPRAADDIEQLEWRPIVTLEDELVSEHRAFAVMLQKHLGSAQIERSAHHATQS